jgi:hypothetical protein
MSNRLRWLKQTLQTMKKYEGTKIMPFYYELLIKEL